MTKMITLLMLQVERRVQEGGIDLIADTKLDGNYPPEIFLKMTILALHCSASEKKERPTMKVTLFSPRNYSVIYTV